MIFYITLRLNEVNLALNALWSKNHYLKKYETYT